MSQTNHCHNLPLSPSDTWLLLRVLSMDPVAPLSCSASPLQRQFHLTPLDTKATSRSDTLRFPCRQLEGTWLWKSQCQQHVDCWA